jgi:hypothetical protein
MKAWTTWLLLLAAHHGSAGYDMQRPVTITGTVRSIEWKNPHSFIYLDVTTEKDAIETWALEGSPPRVLEAMTGWTKDNFKPGTSITVIGFVPRNPTILENALSYSPDAIGYLKTKHVLQAGDIRLASGEVKRFGMGPALGASK